MHRHGRLVYAPSSTALAEELVDAFLVVCSSGAALVLVNNALACSSCSQHQRDASQQSAALQQRQWQLQSSKEAQFVEFISKLSRSSKSAASVGTAAHSSKSAASVGTAAHSSCSQCLCRGGACTHQAALKLLGRRLALAPGPPPCTCAASPAATFMAVYRPNNNMCCMAACDLGFRRSIT